MKQQKCARTACDNHNAVCRHRQTGRMYCPPCARAINEGNSEKEPLVEFPTWFMVLDDDPYWCDVYTKLILEVYPNAVVCPRSSIYEACKSAPMRHVDIIITDMSAIGPIAGGPLSMYGPICSMIEQYGNPLVIIKSAVSKAFCEDVMEDVLKAKPDARLDLIEWNAADDALLDMLKLYKASGV